MKRLFPTIAILLLLAGSTLHAATAIISKEPGGVFFEGDTIAFELADASVQDSYSVTDWLGNALLSGSLKDTKNLSIKPLPQGYYWLKIGDGTASFCIVPTPEARGAKDGRLSPKGLNSPFGMDTAQSWLAKPGDFVCPWYDGDTYRAVTELIYRAGIPHVRERLRWREVKPEQDKPMVLGKYLRNAKMLSEHGITVSAIFHDTQPWTGRRPLLPRDLKALYEFVKEATLAYGDTIGNWEFWNEPDIGFAPEAVWDFASAQKAAFLGIRAANAEIPIGNGATAISCTNPYPNALYENDIASYSNFYNFHTYDFPTDYPHRYKENRDFLEKFDMTGRVQWCTESGPRMEGNAAAVPGHPEWQDHNREQELVVAEFYPKSQLKHWMQGVGRNYYFVFPPCNEGEGGKSWGILRRDGTVKPIYAAISTATARMADAKLMGTLDVAPNVTAYLLEAPDGTQTLCHWANSELDDTAHVYPVQPDNSFETTFDLPLPNGEYSTCTMTGTPGTANVIDGIAKITSTRYPSYIWGFRGLVPATPAIPQGTMQFSTPSWNEDPTIVLQVDWPEKYVRMENQKSTMAMQNSSQEMIINIWNLDEKTAKAGTLDFQGAILESAQSWDTPIYIPPMGMVSMNVRMKPLNPHTTLTQKMILGGQFNGKRISNLVLQYTCNTTDDLMEVPLNIASPEAWRHNDSAREHKVSWDETEQALRFDYDFKNEANRWFYPEHVLNLPDESLEGAVFLQFDIKSTQDKIENDYHSAFLMLLEETTHEWGKATLIDFHPPLNDWETRRIRLVRDDITLSKIQQIRLGANPLGHQITVWYRNFKLLKTK